MTLPFSFLKDSAISQKNNKLKKNSFETYEGSDGTGCIHKVLRLELYSKRIETGAVFKKYRDRSCIKKVTTLELY